MANASSLDPYDKFNFSIGWSASDEEGSSEAVLTTAGFHDCTTPAWTAGKIMYREGNEELAQTPSIGLLTMEDITLSRGLTNDPSFYNWALDAYTPKSKSNSKKYRKTLYVTQLGRDSLPVLRFIIHEAFIVGFKPGSDLVATDDGEKSMEQLTITYKSFEVEYADENGSFR